jgi:pimeloyl-ACP methyl ester carboxylesterase/DNA-binding winged helix-turn-helix (wHTH) protein
MSVSEHRALIYAFGEFELDARVHELRRAGEPCHVEPQVFDVLEYLLARRDRLVTKDELLDAVWGHRFVAPTTLNSRIKAARHAVGDDGSAQRVIKTVHGRGYRVVADVEERAAGAGNGGATRAADNVEGSPPATASRVAGSPVATASRAGESPAAIGTRAALAEEVPSGNASSAPRTGPGQGRLEQRIRFFKSFDGARIAYATSGTGPPLVKPANWLTHLEFDWESPVWRHWLRELSHEHTLIRYDERGSGLSDRAVEDLSFDAWVHDLEGLVDELGLERFPLLGLSQGCAVALAYALRHPERVSRLVLYGGFLLGRIKRAKTPEDAAAEDLIVRQMPLHWGQDNPAFRQFFAAAFLPEGTPEQWRWFCDLQRVSTTPEIAVRLRTTSAQIDVTALAPRVTVPTLVLQATEDGVVPFDAGRELAANIPGARFVPLESKNHVLLEEEPAWARFVEEVRAFLREE